MDGCPNQSVAGYRRRFQSQNILFSSVRRPSVICENESQLTKEQGITLYVVFQQFIQRHRHFLRKCAASIDVFSAGTKAFYMHMVSAQIQTIHLSFHLSFFFFKNHTALNTAADEVYV